MTALEGECPTCDAKGGGAVCTSCRICQEVCPPRLDLARVVVASRWVEPPVDAHWSVFASLATLAAMGAATPMGEWHATRSGVATGDDCVFLPGDAALLDAFFRRPGVEYAAGPHGALLLLAAMGVRPRVLGLSTGHDLYYQGRLDEFAALRDRNLPLLRAALDATGGGPVVCASAEDAHALLDLYSVEAVHVVEALRGHDVPLRPADDGPRLRVAFFDPCRLGRYRGVYDTPRELLSRVAEVVDLGYPRGEEPCCGISAWLGCGERSKVDREAILRRAADSGAQALATACPMCQAHLDCYYFEEGYDPDDAARAPRVRIADVCELVAELGGLRPAGSPRLEPPGPEALRATTPPPARRIARAAPARWLDDATVRAAHLCTMCVACVEACPQRAPVLEHVLRARRALVSDDLSPPSVAALTGPMRSEGNPFGEPRARRTEAYPASLAARIGLSSPEAVLYMGCVYSYQDPRAAEAVARLVEVSGARVAVLGEQEGCCGYVAHISGHEVLFRDVARATAASVTATGTGTLVTPCAGCHRAFATLYGDAVPGWEGGVEALHLVEWLDTLLRDGRLPLSRDAPAVTVAYHDPCDLGRHQGVYDAPRRVLAALPGVRLAEFPASRERAECCGGGGTLRSFDAEVAMQIAERRLRTLPAGVDTVVSACPSCKGNLRLAAARVRRDGGPRLRVLDIAEVVASRLDGGEGE